MADWLICILPLSQHVCQFPFIHTVNQTTLLIVIFTVFWQHCPGNYGKKIKVNYANHCFFPLKSKINLIIHELEGMFYIANIYVTKRQKASFL